MKNVISQSLGLDLVNINVYAKVYQNIPLSSGDRTIFTFSEFEPWQRLGQSQMKLYISSLVPSTVENTSAYHLRDSQNIRPLLTRTQLYYKSFLPACVREWNELPLDIRNSDSLSSFKQQLDKENT